MSVLLSSGYDLDDVDAHRLLQQWINRVHYQLLAFLHVDLVRGKTIQEKLKYVESSPDVKLVVEFHRDSDMPDIFHTNKKYTVLVVTYSQNAEDIGEMICDFYNTHFGYEGDRPG